MVHLYKLVKIFSKNDHQNINTVGIYIYFSNQTWEVDFSANFNIVLRKKTSGCSVQVDVF